YRTCWWDWFDDDSARPCCPRRYRSPRPSSRRWPSDGCCTFAKHQPTPPPVHRRRDYPRPLWPPARCLTGDRCRRRERGNRVSRREGPVRITGLHATPDLPIVRIEAGAVGRRMHERARPSEKILQDAAKDAADDNGFSAVQSQIRHVALLGHAAGDVERAADDERSRLGDRPESDRRLLQELIGLVVLVLKSCREVLVDGTQSERSNDKTTG